MGRSVETRPAVARGSMRTAPATGVGEVHARSVGLACILACMGFSLCPAADWQTHDGIRIPVVPREHPRLYLRGAQVAQLPSRLKDPALRDVARRLSRLADKSPQHAVERDALDYLTTGDRALGRATIEAALPMLQRCVLPDRQDACRVTGRMMVTGAIVYDWCHGLLAAPEKRAFVDEFVRLAKTQECGYPPTRQGSVTGHASEAQIMRDMLSAGIAIHDEFPEMYRLAAGRFFREHLPARNWFYGGHAYHQGTSYGPYRYGWDTFPLFIFDRLGFGNVYNPEQRFVPYLWVYSTRPDGQRLRAGDAAAEGTGDAWSEGLGTILTASYYGDGVLLSQFLKQGGAREGDTIFELLWRDATLRPEPIESLPPARYFGSPFGWMIARTGWGEDAVIAEMKINEYNFTNHQHADAGAFQIYYRGAQAIDSGRYTGSSGRYGSPHCRNYFWRTIAHNSLLIHDPGEDFGDGYGNDGGQRLPGGRKEPRTLDMLLAPENGFRTGQVLAHSIGPDFAYLQGDITAAYSKKVERVIRSFVFLNLHDTRTPAALIVFDRVVSADPAFKKFWLLHTLEEPRIEGASASADRLALDVLLPEADNVTLEKVGGPGKEFWVFGTNYPNAPEERRTRRGASAGGAPARDGWRVEVSPKRPSAEDLFLTVMQLGERLPVKLVEADDRVGCQIGNRRVLLDRGARPSGQPVTFTTIPDARPGDRAR